MMNNRERSAFPLTGDVHATDSGLTKREYFAAMAMQGIVSNQELRNDLRLDGEGIEQYAVELADKLLIELR